MSFPRLLVPRPPINTPPSAGSRPPEKPLGYAKPAAAADSLRSTPVVKVTSHVHAHRSRAPEPPVVIRYDAHGRPTLSPDEVPFW
jgi:hypothetical protein